MTKLSDFDMNFEDNFRRVLGAMVPPEVQNATKVVESENAIDVEKCKMPPEVENATKHR